MMADLGDIAAKLGMHVFACDHRKRPCVAGGFKAATNIRSDIVQMFRDTKAPMIGAPTGHINGIIVIDVDVKGEAQGMEWLNANADALPPTRTHKTQSGGLHLIFKCPDGVEIRNSAGRIAPGIDVRGEGGYIVVPPSPGYQVADPMEPADMPRWLIKACLPAERAKPIHDPITEGGTKYGLAALDDECRAIRNASFGTQETTLNSAALKIGALVAGQQISEAVARQALISAGNSMSSQPGEPAWTYSDIEAKIRRGMQDGSSNPRRPVEIVAPQKSTKPQQAKSEPETLKVPGLLDFTLFQDAKANLDANDFVEGLLTEGALSIVYGQSNAGKTFWVTDLAFHIAAGLPCNGREVTQAYVLYLALEGKYGIMNRIAAFKADNNLEDHGLPFAVVPQSLNLLKDPTTIEQIIATAEHLKEEFGLSKGIVIVDTVARATAGGNENSSEDMGAFIANLDEIKESTNAHVMGIHHSGKDEARGARGWSGLRGAIDTEIEVKEENGSRTAEVVKQRDLPKGDTFGFTLEVVTLGQNRRGKDVTSCVVKPTDQAASAAPDRRRMLKGHTKRAFEVLCDLIASSGQEGHGAPQGVATIPEKWWRDRFYENSMAGAETKVKQNAFRRAADMLVEQHFVAMRAGRVWTVRPGNHDATVGYTS